MEKYGGDLSSADSPFRASPDPGEIAGEPVISFPHRNASLPNPVSGSRLSLKRVMGSNAAGSNNSMKALHQMAVKGQKSGRRD